MNYERISNFAPKIKSAVDNPLTYCLNSNMNQRFLHGSHADTYGQHSRPCQLFLSEYCANNWDGFCEFASKNKSVRFPDQYDGCGGAGVIGCKSLTSGDALIYNTASRKYLTEMLGAKKKYEPFDPTVASSPMISYWYNDCGQTAVPVYEVNPENIDNDIVMNKILNKPRIAMDILINIYNTMKRKGTLQQLQGTRLGQFYNKHPYFLQKGGL